MTRCRAGRGSPAGSSARSPGSGVWRRRRGRVRTAAFQSTFFSSRSSLKVLITLQGQIIGRDAEVGTIERWLGMVAGGPRAVLVEGDIGIGKTAVWREAVGLARDRRFRVMAASPAEADRRLPFAVLGDLFRDIPDALWSDLPGPQLRALRVALLQADPEDAPAEPHAVGLAVLSVLRNLGRSGPVLAA